MSFVIDEEKIAALLRTSETSYKVSIAPGGAAVETHYYDPVGYGGISGTIAIDPVIASREARGHLLTIRGRIEKSGSPLHGEKELSEELERMRGR